MVRGIDVGVSVRVAVCGGTCGSVAGATCGLPAVSVMDEELVGFCGGGGSVVQCPDK